MLSRILILIVFILEFGLVLNSEIIKVSFLKREKLNFTLGRDISSPFKLKGTNNKREFTPQNIKDIRREKNEKKNLEEEIQRSIFYEGYITNNSKIIALLTVNGEFFCVCDGDEVLNKIKVIKVGKKEIILEVDSKKFEIKLKGDDDDEK